jgi:hypothetical protein
MLLPTDEMYAMYSLMDCRVEEGRAIRLGKIVMSLTMQLY